MQENQNSKSPEFVHWARFDEAGRPTEMGTIDDFNRLPKDKGYVQITEEQAKKYRENGPYCFKSGGTKEVVFVRAYEKIDELSVECKQNIEKGITYNGKQYSLKQEDQQNINSMYAQVMMPAPLSDRVLETPKMTYHANGEHEEYISNEDVIALKQLMDAHIQQCRIAFNGKKFYLQSLGCTDKDAEIIKNMQLDSEIPVEFQSNFYNNADGGGVV